jgi:S-disulfanyl-L-cysteine oxidoreductase SoxD
MATRHLQWSAAAVGVAFIGCAAGAGILAQTPPARKSVWDGVYTDAQAERGGRLYGRSCEQCHGPDMAGDQVEEIPSLVLDSFMTDWNGKSVRELFDTVKRSMPKDKPGSLGTGAYVDVIAYLLQANKFPSGTRELSRAPEQLDPIVIEREKAQ